MSSIVQGLSGFLLAYTAVEAPFAAALLRRGAGVGKVASSALLSVPLTLIAGVATMTVDPLLHAVGFGRGSILELSGGVGVSVGIGYLAGRLLARPAAASNAHRRGTLIESANTSNTGANRSNQSGDEGNQSRPLESDRRRSTEQRLQRVTLAGLPVELLDETKHFKIIGTTGTGKSTAIRELLGGALGRGDRAIIADPDGGYLKRFGQPSRGDVILNPFAPDSRRWDLFGEIDKPYDIDELARSLLPDPGGPDKSWVSYARTFFTSVTRQAREAGVSDIRELYDLLVVSDRSELRALVEGTPAQPFLEEHNGRMFDSIRSITSSAVGSLEYIAQQDGSPLSVRKWVRQGSGALFVPYKAGEIAALRSTVSAWMRLAIFEAMSQPEGDQRLWFVVDELDALGQIDGLKDALARLRKFGGRVVLGFQSIAQVSATYGGGEARTIVENCGNTLILRSSGSEPGGTAHFASQLIGQREIVRTSRSRSRHVTDFLPSITISEHVGIEPAVMDSEIEQLPDLNGFLKFASRPAWRRVSLAARPAADPDAVRAEARMEWGRSRAGVAATGEASDEHTTANRIAAATGRDFD